MLSTGDTPVWSRLLGSKLLCISQFPTQTRPRTTIHPLEIFSCHRSPLFIRLNDSERTIRVQLSNSGFALTENCFARFASLPLSAQKCPQGQYGDSCISLLLPTIGESSIPWPGREWHSCVRCGTRAADLPRHKQRERRPSEGTGTPFPLASGHPRRSGRSPIANGIPRKEIRGRHQRHKCCGLEHAPARPKSR